LSLAEIKQKLQAKMKNSLKMESETESCQSEPSLNSYSSNVNPMMTNPTATNPMMTNPMTVNSSIPSAFPYVSASVASTFANSNVMPPNPYPSIPFCFPASPLLSQNSSHYCMVLTATGVQWAQLTLLPGPPVPPAPVSVINNNQSTIQSNENNTPFNQQKDFDTIENEDLIQKQDLILMESDDE
jgi:hypothetical protein